jgi:hypothetical protein
MMAKFGFKQGDTLGKSEDARKEPIRVDMKGDKSGIGLESEKKRKFREQWAQAEREAKRSKEEEGDYVEIRRLEAKEKKTERDLHSAQRTAERLSEQEAEDKGTPQSAEKPWKDVNILWRTRARRRAVIMHEKQQRRELNNSIASRLPAVATEDDDEEDDSKVAQGRELAPFYTSLEDELEDEDPELAEFEALPIAERLEKLLMFLREKFHYCFYCGYQYPDAELEGCPGVTDEEHD